MSPFVSLVALVALATTMGYKYGYGRGSPGTFYKSLDKWGNGDGSNSGCRNPEHNVVFCCAGNDYHVNRDWTMDGGLVHSLVSGKVKPPSDNSEKATETCKDIPSVMQAVQESLQSAEETRSCTLPWLTPKDVCKIFGHYSGVFWSGDSLTRHMLQAFYIILRDNMENGWKYPASFKGWASENGRLETKCTCDGQFSENKVCRQLPEETFKIEQDELFQQFCPSYGEVMMNEGDPPGAAAEDEGSQQTERKLSSSQENELISNIEQGQSKWLSMKENSKSNKIPSAQEYYDVKNTQFHFNGYQMRLIKGQMKDPMNNWCSAKPGLRLLFMQMGPHSHNDPQTTIKTYFAPLLHKLSVIVKSCQYDISPTIRVIASGSTSTDKILWKKFPYQTDWAVERHEIFMKNYFAEVHPFVHYLSFVEIQKSGKTLADDTSDGVHTLTSINIAKSLSVVTLMGHFSYAHTTENANRVYSELPKKGRGPPFPTDVPGSYTFTTATTKDGHYGNFLKSSMSSNGTMPWATYNMKYEGKAMTWEEEENLQRERFTRKTEKVTFPVVLFGKGEKFTLMSSRRRNLKASPKIWNSIWRDIKRSENENSSQNAWVQLFLCYKYPIVIIVMGIIYAAAYAAFIVGRNGRMLRSQGRKHTYNDSHENKPGYVHTNTNLRALGLHIKEKSHEP